jgi:hypothetical protein
MTLNFSSLLLLSLLAPVEPAHPSAEQTDATDPEVIFLSGNKTNKTKLNMFRGKKPDG